MTAQELSSSTRSWKRHKGRLCDSHGDFEVIACETCGFKHVIPIPTEQELATIYEHEYYTRDKPQYFQHAAEDLDWWMLQYSERYDTFERFLPAGYGDRRLLDVGSGPGYFLACGQERGWSVVGIEPSQQAAEHARGLGVEVRETFFTEEAVSDLEPFDAIHMSEVLEHVPDPAQFVRRSHQLLKPDGILCVIVPNDYSPFQNALRTVRGFSPWWVAPPHHLNYFDFDSVSALLESNGFEVVLKEATFPIDMFLLMGDNYVGNDALGRACHAKRKRLERTLAEAGLTELKRQLYRCFAEHGVGREALVVGRRS